MNNAYFFKKAVKHPFWKNVPDELWYNWKWQMKNTVNSVEELKSVISISGTESGQIQNSLKILRMRITPYYLSQYNNDEKDCAIRLQSVPKIEETENSENDLDDPLGEDIDCPDSQLKGYMTHRYPDRVILYITYQCAMYCRHCTRRRYAGVTDIPTPLDFIEKAVEYIKKNSSIREVILSGGDPFTLEDNHLERIIKMIRSVQHVDIIRIHTRTPVVLPMRITKGICKMLNKYHPIWINTQFNHPKEMTDLSSKACNMLADAGIPLGNQSVLLRKVNNHPLIMKKLVKLLVANRVRPYYIYQCDLSQGIEHFRTRVSEGVAIIESLRGHTSGYAVPQFVVDGIGGSGKVPIMPNYVLAQYERGWILRNYEGVIFKYAEPNQYKYEGPQDIDKYIDQTDSRNILGIGKLIINDKETQIIPRDLIRERRR